MQTRIPGLGAHCHRRGREVLDLFQLEIHALGEDGQLGHVLLVASRMAADEVGDDLLAQSVLAVDAVEDALEVAEEAE